MYIYIIKEIQLTVCHDSMQIYVCTMLIHIGYNNPGREYGLHFSNIFNNIMEVKKIKNLC